MRVDVQGQTSVPGSVGSSFDSVVVSETSVEVSSGTLIVKEKKHFAKNYKDPILTVTVPSGTVFERADIVTGAGRLTADKLSARYLELALGAGETIISEMYVSMSADISGGAGKLTVKGGELCDLDLEMGLGELNLKSKLLGDSDIQLGVGEANIRLLGSEDDYRLDIDKGIGSIMLDGKTYNGNFSVGSGKNTVDIDGGVGSINIAYGK